LTKALKLEKRPASQPGALKGWKQIADFPGEPFSVVSRWRSEGMPVIEQGRLVSSSPEKLSAWLERESGKPVHMASA
jgi:hypothetical protein